jgi:hypothetical protein
VPRTVRELRHGDNAQAINALGEPTTRRVATSISSSFVVLVLADAVRKLQAEVRELRGD